MMSAGCEAAAGMYAADAHLLVSVSGASQEQVGEDHAGRQAVNANRLSGRLRLPIQAAHEMSNACAQIAS